MQLKHLKPNAFKRKCSIHRETFEQMVEVLRPQLERTGKRGGQNKLGALRPITVGTGVLARSRRRSASREYRTQFHIAISWGLSEAAVCRLIHAYGTIVARLWQIPLAWEKAATAKMHTIGMSL